MTQQDTLDTLFGEMEEHVLSFFIRKNDTDGKKDLQRSCRDFLSQIKTPQMLDIIDTYPVYGALAFLGQLSFEDCAEVHRLAVSNSPEVLEAIRAKMAVKVSEDALPDWQHFCKHKSEEVVCTILCLCYHAKTNPKTKRYT